MNIKQTSTPLVIGLVSTAICFSFSFFTNVFKYNGLEFFYAYIAFLILLCYPMNLVAIHLQKTLPNLGSHSKLIAKITGTSKLKPISILLTGTVIILVSLVMFNISTYVLDFFDNIPAIDKLSDASLEFNSNLPIYSSLTAVFIIIFILFILTSFEKINLNNLLKTTAHISLYLVIILMLMVIYLPQSINGIHDFLFQLNYQSTEQLRSMFELALIYAILSNFISIAFYKNLININDNNYKKLKVASFKSIFYNIVFSFIICITIYSILGNYRTYLQPHESMPIELVFQIVKANSPTYYLLLEVVFITLNLVVFISALKYIYRLGNNIYTKLIFLIIPLIMTISLIETGIAYIDFSDMFGLHLLIIFLFLFDVFIIGWIYDAQKLSYEILKHTNIKLSPLFNIILRIVIPFICIFVTIGYIFLPMSIMWQFIATITCIIIYIIKGSIFSNILNQRKF
ncbi:hypothetical protein CDV26_03930 [Francisella halioticida]|uniref:Sodium-dependent transporter n=1 Tax=Francisella halioticida TaxID=549298 RepID=A0ABN5AUN9_9GAMM|nr:hypothetical protein [Francisella halioticida]ASG67651.1 hypothetical protein CDV26_03930 [Francisella halioticida]